MLTDRQKYYFYELKINESQEQQVRRDHKELLERGESVPKDFTRYLEKRVQKAWERRRISRFGPYLGD